jgi:hypothetical protein
MLLGAWEDADVEDVLAGVSAAPVRAASEPEGAATSASGRAGNRVGQR